MSGHCTCVADPDKSWFETSCEDCRSADLQQWLNVIADLQVQAEQIAAEIAATPIYFEMLKEYGDA